ncbi:MAG: hypothetical protein K6G72_05755 [Lachnospiraceae bacterium]|nr:hypothetical protein [Lachnospiraceae bacterium]
MKKKTFITSIVVMALMASTACGGTDDAKRTAPVSQNITVSTLIEEAQAEETEEVKEEPEVSVSVEETPGSESVEEVTAEISDVDLDLTQLSKTMVYAEVYNIMMEPETYVGKSIRMNGDYYIYTDDTTGQQYFYCVIRDATACCAQGIEFVLTDDYKFPEDYPEEGAFVTVSGRFDTYMEDDLLYCTLRDAVLEN